MTAEAVLRARYALARAEAPSVFPPVSFYDVTVATDPAAYHLESGVAVGHPWTRVRKDYVVEDWQADHEIRGHIGDKLRDLRDVYWQFRFGGKTSAPQTWAQAQIDAGGVFRGAWAYLPIESLAEAARLAFGHDGPWDRSMDYGYRLDVPAARAFFRSRWGAATPIGVTERFWIPAATDRYSVGRGGVKIDTLVFHTSTTTWQQTIDTFQGGPRIVSAHFVVDKNVDRIAQVVSTADTAWHCGDWPTNLRSIGIEFVDDGDWNGLRPDGLYTRGHALVNELVQMFGITRFLRHNQVIATACPDALDVERLISGGTEVPTQAEWDTFKAGYSNTIDAMKNVLAQLAHAKHPVTTTIGEHVLSPQMKKALNDLDRATAKMGAKKARKAPSKSAVQAGHGRGK